MNILLLADGSEYTKRAARYLADHVSQLATPPVVMLLNVHAAIPYGGVSKKAVEEYQEEECRKALSVAEKELDKSGIKYQSAWKVGEVADVVADFVRDSDIHLIVMGSRGQGALAGLVMGSTGTKVIAATKVPVLIVR